MAQQVSVTLRGKSYVISTDANPTVLHEAASMLDRTMETLFDQGIKREDQLALFSALMTLVDVMKDRESYKAMMHDHTERLRAALDV